MMKHRKTGFELKHTKKDIVLVKCPPHIYVDEDNPPPSPFEEMIHFLENENKLQEDYFFIVIQDYEVTSISMLILNNHNPIPTNKTQLRYLEAINKAIQKHDH